MAGTNENKILIKSISDAFGFDYVHINYINNSNANMSTLLSSMCVDLGHKKLANSLMPNKMKYKKGSGISCFININTGILFNTNMSDEELMALFLHEIGHNFTAAVSDKLLYNFPVLLHLLGLFARISEIVANNFIVGSESINVSDIFHTKDNNNNSNKTLSKSDQSTISFDINFDDLDFDYYDEDIYNDIFGANAAGFNINKLVSSFKTGTDIISAIGGSIVAMFFSSNFAKKFTIKFNKIIMDAIKDNKFLLSIVKGANCISGIGSLLLDSLLYIKNIFSLVTQPLGAYSKSNVSAILVNGIKTALSNPTGYYDERFADSFATMYGYGPQLISAIDKLYIQPKNFAQALVSFDGKFPIVDMIYDVYTLPLTILAETFDPHPNTLARAKDVIDNLENELSSDKNMDPVMKKAIMKDIQNTKIAIDDYKHSRNGLRGDIAHKLYESMVYTAFGGGFKRKLFGKGAMKDIDKLLKSETVENLDMFMNW